MTGGATGEGSPTATQLLHATMERTGEVVAALAALDDPGLGRPSTLPGWSRLTIACHLRYGAEALVRMTDAILAGEPTSYYPEGRDGQRPGTLRPRPGESGSDVVRSLARFSERLHERWREVTDAQWRLPLVEPPANRDLGPIALHRLLLLRLTEVEIHGTDLDLGLAEWSDVFVDAALPFRVDWLRTRRSNHRAPDGELHATWLLAATDGPTYAVTATGSGVEAHPLGSADPSADAVIEAPRRDLLALLLGRPLRTQPRYRGDVELAAAFSRAFPGP